MPLAGAAFLVLIVGFAKDDPGLDSSVVPAVFLKVAEPDAGDIIAMRGYTHRQAMVVGKTGDVLRLEPDKPWPERLVVSSPRHPDRVLELQPAYGTLDFPERVPAHSLLVFGRYYGVNGDSQTGPVAAIIDADQVEGVVLADWQTAAVYVAIFVCGAAWLAGVAFLLGGARSQDPEDEPSRPALKSGQQSGS